jgi:hypothetical protein
MLSALKKTAQKVSANALSENTVRQKGYERNKQTEDWREKVNDEITAGSNYWKNHQERYQFVKNRTYYPTRKALREANAKET